LSIGGARRRTAGTGTLCYFVRRNSLLPMMRRARHVLTTAPGSLVLAGIVLCGCAASYMDAQGRQHVIGFVDISTTPARGPALAGDIVEVTTLGVSVLSTTRETSLAIGYNRVTTAAFRDNALALGPFDERAFRQNPEETLP
jgi:hypothetical protein